MGYSSKPDAVSPMEARRGSTRLLSLSSLNWRVRGGRAPEVTQAMMPHAYAVFSAVFCLLFVAAFLSVARAK